MSARQDLRLELQDFLNEYKFKIESHINANVMENEYVECGDCGHEVYVEYSDSSIGDLAEDVMKIIHDDHHNEEVLCMLMETGDLARKILNNAPTPSTTNHQQFDGAMKGLG